MVSAIHRKALHITDMPFFLEIFNPILSASPTWLAKVIRRLIDRFGLRITESTWRVAEGSYFTFCCSVLSLEGKDQVSGKTKQSAHHREVPLSSTMSPNVPEHDDANGWCNTAMNYTKGRITELIGELTNDIE
uniref:Uncharacterized protein n=1 Tax=Solanum tuberosum TaxID=4113 RepID=M1DGF9_SOLTU